MTGDVDKVVTQNVCEVVQYEGCQSEPSLPFVKNYISDSVLEPKRQRDVDLTIHMHLPGLRGGAGSRRGTQPHQ